MEKGFSDTISVVLPRYTIGPQAYGALASVLPSLGSSIMLICGEKAMAAGQKAFEQALEGTALKLKEVIVHKTECTVAKAQALATKAKEAGVQIVAGMGGGKAIDTAKACARFAGLPVVTIPTIAATCAAVTALSVMYLDDGSFDRFLYLPSPPHHAFIHTGIIASAPSKYLRAGMGDAIAKHFESTFSARGDELYHGDSLGLSISRTCYEPLLVWGEAALRDCENGVDSIPFREAVLSNIVSTGLVSLLVKDCYNGALAHSLFYALEPLPEIAHGCLHGDVVAYGVLVQLFMDGQTEKASKVFRFLVPLGIPVSLAAMGVDCSSPAFLKALDAVTDQPDMAHLPYTVTKQMVRDAVLTAEKYAAEHTDLGGLKVV